MLIALYSPIPQSGKSTVAGCLLRSNCGQPDAARHTFRVPFAGTLKAMAKTLLDDLGYDCAADMLEGNKSEIVYEEKTLRHLLQTLGTEWGRRCMGTDFWVDIWARKVRNYLLADHHVVVDDMRFPNEFIAVRALGGQCWKIARPGATAATNGHASEGALDHLPFDREIVNSGSLGDLHLAVEAALEDVTRGSQEAVQAPR